MKKTVYKSGDLEKELEESDRIEREYKEASKKFYDAQEEYEINR